MPSSASALACPSPLKGVLDSPSAAAALAAGFRQAGVGCDECPLADGGEGTTAVLANALGGTAHAARVSDPLGRPVDARWLELPDGRGVVEAADPLGLGRLSVAERDPLRASSRGLGELILSAGDRPLVICLGGTATVDGGLGLREVVPRLPSGSIVACDVSSGLLDAARLFARQKGADDEGVAELGRRLRDDVGLAPFAGLAGAGAAGGLGAALAALGGELIPGAAFVLDAVGFEERLRRVTLAVTGEGTVDRTTREGKAPFEVARRAVLAGVRCVVFGGLVQEPVPSVETVALSGDPGRATEDLHALGTRLGRDLLE
jgi:glycerate kinase